MKLVHDFMRDNTIVINSSTLNKSHLIWGDDLREKRLEFVGNELGDYFVGDITEAYWSELLDFRGVGDLRDQSNKSVV